MYYCLSPLHEFAHASCAAIISSQAMAVISYSFEEMCRSKSGRSGVTRNVEMAKHWAQVLCGNSSKGALKNK
jgi:hypothetical protein